MQSLSELSAVNNLSNAESLARRAPSRTASFAHSLLRVSNNPINHSFFNISDLPGQLSEDASATFNFSCLDIALAGKETPEELISELINTNCLSDSYKEQMIRERVNQLGFAGLYNVAEGRDFREFEDILKSGLLKRCLTSSALPICNAVMTAGSAYAWLLSSILPEKSNSDEMPDFNFAAAVLASSGASLILPIDIIAKRIRKTRQTEINRCQFLAKLRLNCMRSEGFNNQLPLLREQRLAEVKGDNKQAEAESVEFLV